MRTPGRWRPRRAGRVLSAVGAVVVSALLLGILGFGYGTIPALGPALDPGRGAWTSAYDGTPATPGCASGPTPAPGPPPDPGRGAWTSAYDGTPVPSQALHVPGLAKPVT